MCLSKKYIDIYLYFFKKFINMTTNDKKEINNIYSLKVNNISREITQKNSPETEKITPTGVPEVYNNSNLTLHNSGHEHETQSSNNKKNEEVNTSKNKCKKIRNYRRVDSFGNPISKKGKQKISFIDKITNNKFVEVIKIESYKAYNKMEEITHTDMKNNCCLIE